MPSCRAVDRDCMQRTTLTSHLAKRHERLSDVRLGPDPVHTTGTNHAVVVLLHTPSLAIPALCRSYCRHGAIGALSANARDPGVRHRCQWILSANYASTAMLQKMIQRQMLQQ